MRYNRLTRRYFDFAPHAGVLSVEGTDACGAAAHGAGKCRVFRGSAGNRERGTWVQFDIQVADAQCTDARFLALGCPHTIAAASWVAEHGIGTALRAGLPEPVASLAQRFEVPAEKLGRLLIVEDAWRAAARAAIENGFK